MRKVKGNRDANSCSTMLVFLLRYQEAHKLPLVLVGHLARKPLQGPSSRSSNSVDSLGPSPRISGSPTCLPTSLFWMLLAIFTIKLLAKTAWALFPLVHGGGHTTNTVGAISQDYKPLRCTTMVHASTECKRYANITKH